MPAIKLTKAIVETLIADASKPVTIVRDSLVTGLQLRAYLSGRKTFVLDYRTRSGASRTLTLGTFPTLTVAQARELAEEARREVVVGGDPAKARREKKTAQTVAALCDRYLIEHVEPHNARSTAKEVRRIIATRVKPCLGNIKVADLSREEIKRWHLSMKHIPAEANRSLAYFRKALSLAVRDWNYRPDNPARGINLFKEVKRERFLSELEQARLGKALAQAERLNSEHASVIAAIRLLIFTGCRLSEIMTLQWNHVSFERHALLLPKSKTGPKTVYLAGPAFEVLTKIARQPENPYVISGTRPGAAFKGIHKAWNRLRKVAGLEDVRIHDLRHSFASVGVAGGLSLPIIGKLLGHTHSTTTQRYAHLSDDPVRAAAEQVAERVRANMSAGLEKRSG